MSRPNDDEWKAFYFKVDQIPELHGAGVAYVGDGSCEVVRPSEHSSGLPTFVIVKEDEELTAAPDPRTPPSNIAEELLGLGLNCGGAVLSLAAFAAEAAAVPVSGGTSSLVMGVTIGAGIATTLQCANSIMRSVDVAAGDGALTARLDSQDWYTDFEYFLDVVSIAGAAAAGAATVRTVLVLRRATGRELPDILRGLSRAERKRLMQEVIRMERPGISNSGMKALIRAGTFPARFASAELNAALFDQLRDAISATLAFVGSATSGVLKRVWVGVYQE